MKSKFNVIFEQIMKDYKNKYLIKQTLDNSQDEDWEDQDEYNEEKCYEWDKAVLHIEQFIFKNPEYGKWATSDPYEEGHMGDNSDCEETIDIYEFDKYLQEFGYHIDHDALDW